MDEAVLVASLSFPPPSLSLPHPMADPLQEIVEERPVLGSCRVVVYRLTPFRIHSRSVEGSSGREDEEHSVRQGSTKRKLCVEFRTYPSSRSGLPPQVKEASELWRITGLRPTLFIRV